MCFFLGLFWLNSYDLDPDDGYDGKVLLPYESYYTNDYKSTSPIQSTIEPSYLPKPTLKPIKNAYNLKVKPINTLGSISYDPYEVAVTTHDTHQHLTETTPIQPHQNFTRIDFKPFTFDNYMPTSNSKPLIDVLQNMNRTSLQLLLTKLKENNYLPKSFTMNKLDNSLRTLAKVLIDLKKSQKLHKNTEFSTTPLSYHRPTKIQAIKQNYDDGKLHYPLKHQGKCFFLNNCLFSKSFKPLLCLFTAPGPQSGKFHRFLYSIIYVGNIVW